jgi:hypothetical protein
MKQWQQFLCIHLASFAVRIPFDTDKSVISFTLNIFYDRDRWTTYRLLPGLSTVRQNDLSLTPHGGCRVLWEIAKQLKTSPRRDAAITYVWTLWRGSQTHTHTHTRCHFYSDVSLESYLNWTLNDVRNVGLNKLWTVLRFDLSRHRRLKPRPASNVYIYIHNFLCLRYLFIDAVSQIIGRNV